MMTKSVLDIHINGKDAQNSKTSLRMKPLSKEIECYICIHPIFISGTMMRKFILMISILVFSFSVLTGQEANNQTDSKGLKQGEWISKYPNGNTRYTGFFKNDKPVGIWKRFHENGRLKAKLLNSFDIDKTYAELYDQDGVLYAKGIFVKTAKDSTWSYFNGAVLVAEEDYTNGVKNGKSVNYYHDGTRSSESNWVNGKLSGTSRSFYPSGMVKAEMQYSEGRRNGKMFILYDSGQKEVEGQYINDNMDGNWQYLDEEGNLKYELKYKSGDLLNKEVLEKLEKEEFTLFDRAKGVLKDPANFIENPDEYIDKAVKP